MHFFNQDNRKKLNDTDEPKSGLIRKIYNLNTNEYLSVNGKNEFVGKSLQTGQNEYLVIENKNFSLANKEYNFMYNNNMFIKYNDKLIDINIYNL